MRVRLIILVAAVLFFQRADNGSADYRGQALHGR